MKIYLADGFELSVQPHHDSHGEGLLPDIFTSQGVHRSLREALPHWFLASKLSRSDEGDEDLSSVINPPRPNIEIIVQVSKYHN